MSKRERELKDRERKVRVRERVNLKRGKNYIGRKNERARERD